MIATLITGSNKGLGYQAARQLLAAGHTVYVGARDPDRGRQAAQRLGARFVQLDVTDDASTAVVNLSSGLSKTADLANPDEGCRTTRSASLSSRAG